jgi:hypothetical protein
MADKSTVAKVLDAQVKDDYFGDVVKRIILNNVMNRLHGDEIELFSILTFLYIRNKAPKLKLSEIRYDLI